MDKVIANCIEAACYASNDLKEMLANGHETCVKEDIDSLADCIKDLCEAVYYASIADAMEETTEVGRYADKGLAYHNYDIARKHTEHHEPKHMDSKEQLEEFIDSSKDVYHSATPEVQHEFKMNLTKMIDEL